VPQAVARRDHAQLDGLRGLKLALRFGGYDPLLHQGVAQPFPLDPREGEQAHRDAGDRAPPTSIGRAGSSNRPSWQRPASWRLAAPRTG
jgi:hypothetical protein